MEMLRDDKRKLMKDKLSVQTELDDHKCKQMDNERVGLCRVVYIYKLIKVNTSLCFSYYKICLYSFEFLLFHIAKSCIYM